MTEVRCPICRRLVLMSAIVDGKVEARCARCGTTMVITAPGVHSFTLPEPAAASAGRSRLPNG